MGFLNLALKYLLKYISLWHGIWVNAYLRVFVYWVEEIVTKMLEEIYVECILDEAPISQYPQLEDLCDYMTWVDTQAMKSMESV